MTENTQSEPIITHTKLDDGTTVKHTQFDDGAWMEHHTHKDGKTVETVCDASGKQHTVTSSKHSDGTQVQHTEFGPNHWEEIHIHPDGKIVKSFQDENGKRYHVTTSEAAKIDRFISQIKPDCNHGGKISRVFAMSRSIQEHGTAEHAERYYPKKPSEVMRKVERNNPDDKTPPGSGRSK